MERKKRCARSSKPWIIRSPLGYWICCPPKNMKPHGPFSQLGMGDTPLEAYDNYIRLNKS